MIRIPCVAFVSLALIKACLAAPGAPGAPADLAQRSGDEIVVCGQYFHTGTRVVLWSDPGGYDATNLAPPPVTRPADNDAQPPRTLRGPDITLDELRRNVDQFVLHFDACGNSRECFRVLKRRGLSVHFMCDLDGTIYQTLDLRHSAWHATIANTRSVGVEIANIGAFSADSPMPPAWRESYQFHGTVTTIAIPRRFGDGGGILTPHFIGRPARPEPVTGIIQGKLVRQFDFTVQQYTALANLSATLCTVLPKIQPDFPRQKSKLGPPSTAPATQPAPADPTTQPSALADPDEPGALITHVLTPEQFDAYQGLLGHYHVQLNKDDPGPAFQWMSLIARTRSLMTQQARTENVRWRHQPAGTAAPSTRPATTAPTTAESGD